MLDQQTITLICNAIIIAIFILIFLSCLTGIRKGLIKSGVKLFSWIILLAIIYGLNMTFTSLVYDYDLTFIIQTFNLPTTFPLNDLTISLDQSIGNILTDVLESYNITEGSRAVEALAKSILAFVVLVLNLLLSLIICPILTFILYHLIFNPIFKRITRNHKFRIGGLVVNGLKTAIVASCFLYPLFSITESLSRNYNEGIDEDYVYNENQANETWKMIYPVVNGYNDSFLHSFFSVITGSGTNNGYLTTNVEGSDTTVNFVDVSGSVFAVAVSAFSSAKDMTTEALVTAMLSDHTLEVFTEQILQSTFLMGEVVPVAATIGIRMLCDMDDNVILSKEDGKLISAEIGKIDFGNDLKSYVELFRILNRENLIVDMINDQGSFDFEFSRGNQKVLKEALNKFDELQNQIKEDKDKTTILDVVLPPVIASLVKNSSTDELPLNTILSENPNDYRDLGVVNILQSVSDVLFNFNDLYRNVIAKYENKSFEEVENIKVSTFNELSTKTGRLLQVLFDDCNASTGYDDPRLQNNLKAIDLFKGNEIDKGLLDIPMLLKSFPNLLELAINTSFSTEEGKGFMVLPQEAIDEIKVKISNISEEFKLDKDKWASEVNALLEFIGTIFNKEDLPIMMVDENGQISNKQIDFAEIDFKKAIPILKNTCAKLDNSSLASTLFPSILENMGLENLESLKQFNIQKGDFNFYDFSKNTSLGQEFIELLDGFEYLIDIDFNENTNIFLSEAPIEDSLSNAFEHLTSCEIINRPNDIEHNVLKKIIVSVMNTKEMQDMGISIDERVLNDKLRDPNAINSELQVLCNVIRTIRTSDSLKSLITSKEPIEITSLEGKDVETLISNLSESDLLRPCISSVLEKQLSEPLNSMGINPEYLDFEALKIANKETLKVEAHSVGNMIDELKTLIGEEKVENIDWVRILTDSSKKEIAQSLLENLSSLKLLSTPYISNAKSEIKEDRFGLIIYSFIKPALNDFITNENESQVKNDFSFTYSKYFVDENTNVSESQRNAMWKQEIAKLMDVLNQIDQFIQKDENGNIVKDENDNIVIDIILNKENMTKIRSLLLGYELEVNHISGINDLTLFRTILSSMLEKMLKDESMLKIEGFNLNESFIYVSAFENDHELNFIHSNNSNLFQNFINNNFSSTDIENKSNRELEIMARGKEINAIMNVVDELIGIDFELKSETLGTMIDPIDRALLNAHDSIIFHSAHNIENIENKLTLFEYVIYSILDKTVKVELYDNDTEMMKNVILNITSAELSGVLNSTSWVGQNGEIEKLKISLENINSLKTIDGQDTTLKKYILGTYVGDISIHNLNEDVEHKEIELMLLALSNSNLFNPSESIYPSTNEYTSLLGKMFDKKIGNELGLLGMENHSFANTEVYNNDWNTESSTLSELINSIKSVTNDGNGGYLNVSDIVWMNHENSDKLNILLNSIYDVPSISGVYDTNTHATSFGDLIYKILEKNFFDTNTTEQEKINVKADVYFIESNSSTETWKDNENNEGQLSKLKSIIDSSSEDKYGIFVEGSFTPENLTTVYNGVNNTNNEIGIAILKEINNAAFLRSVLASLIKNQLINYSNLTIGELSLSKIYENLFTNELNYKLNNTSFDSTIIENERQDRLHEIDYLITVIQNAYDLNTTLSDPNVSINSFKEDTKQAALFDMLDAMNNSEFFHVNRHKVDEIDQTTFFEDTIIMAFTKLSLSSLLYNADRDKAYNDYHSKMVAYVKNISFGDVFEDDTNTNNVFDSSEARTWKQELSSLRKSVKDLSLIDNLTSQYGNEVDVSLLTPEETNILLTCLNNSYLTQDGVANSIKKITDIINIESYRIDKEETSTSPDYYLANYIDINDSYLTKKAIWNEEIIPIIELKNLVGSSLEIIDFTSNTSNIDISLLLLNGSKSKIVQPMFYDFIYSMFDSGSTKLSKYFSSVADSNNPQIGFDNQYNGDTYSEQKKRRDTIKYLDFKYSINWEIEGQFIESILNTLSNNTSIAVSGDGFNLESVNTISTLFASSYKYSGTEYDYTQERNIAINIQAASDMINVENYQRGYIVSELLLNFFDKKMAPLGVTEFSELRYDYSYLCFNNYEKVALEQIMNLYLDFSNITNIAQLITKLSENESSFRMMGPGKTIDNLKRDETFTLLKDGYNSNIAVQLLNNGYLEEALNSKSSIGITFKDCFKVQENTSIEYCSSNVWPNNVRAMLI